MNQRLPIFLSMALAIPLAGLSACGGDGTAADADSGVVADGGNTDGGTGETDSGVIDQDAGQQEDAGHGEDAGTEEDAGADDGGTPDAGACLDECAGGETVNCMTFDVEVASTWPAADATDVPVTSVVVVNFNQGMFPNSLKAIGDPNSDKDYNVVLSKKGSGTPVVVTKSNSADKTSFVYKPNKALDPDTEYQMFVKGGGCTNGTNEAARSQNDTKMRDDFVFTFKTGAADVTAEEVKVVSVIPENGATGVGLVPSVTVTFNQPVQLSTVTLVPDGQGASPKTQGTFWVSDSPSYIFPEEGDLTFSADMTSATYRPKAPLKAGKTYYVGLKGCADLSNPSNGKCVRGLAGSRMGDDFGSTFSTLDASEGSISGLVALAGGLSSDQETAVTNVYIDNALMTYYRDVSDNEGFFIQKAETVGGETRQVGIYVNTRGKAPLIPVWPMFHSEKAGWTSDEFIPVAEDEWDAFADYPMVRLSVTQVGVSDGMPYVVTDGYPQMSRVKDEADPSADQEDYTLAEIMDSGIVPVFSQDALRALRDGGDQDYMKKLLPSDDLLNTMAIFDGYLMCYDSCKHQFSLGNVWLDLKWGLPLNESDGVIYDQTHRIRVLLDDELRQMIGIAKNGTSRKHVRIMAPVQKRSFDGEDTLYVKPYKMSAVECVTNGEGTTCTPAPKTLAEIQATPELVRDIVVVKDEAAAAAGDE